MKPPRGLSEAERALWARVTETVTPLARPDPTVGVAPSGSPPDPPATPSAGPVPPRPRGRVASARPAPATVPPPPALPSPAGAGLDSHWERRLRAAAIGPDFTLDLHGHSLDAAHRRLEAGLAQARALGARLVLVVTGKPRPVEAADRGRSRGAIRAKILDWLAAGPFAQDIAAIRPAHPRHGGEGALYLVLRRRS